MKAKNEFYEALRHLSRNESHVQKAWEQWNEVEWETEFEYDDLKESDCVIYPDYTISFVENGWGKNYVGQNGGFVLYQFQTRDLMEVLELIEDKMKELYEQGYGSDDC